MNPLDVPCPHCKAEPGAKCKNYRGKGTAPHRDRMKAARTRDEHRQQATPEAEHGHEKIRPVQGELFP